MGIKDLKKFLRNKNLIHSTNISEYKGKKIAIDISSYIYKYFMIFSNDWLSCFPQFITLFKECDVHCTFVFDGKAPVEKNVEREKRKKAKTDTEERVNQVKKDLEIYKISKVVSELLKETMDKIKSGQIKSSRLSLLYETDIEVDCIEEYISKLEKRVENINYEDIEKLKSLLTLLGVPYIESPVEAEAMCAYLYSLKEFDAVITEDTDILVYGVNIYLSNLNSQTGDIECVYLEEVLKDLNMTMESFVDFCVMCGTDYNTNIPKVGIQKSYKLISEHHTIEKVLDILKTDGACLCKDRTRELFKTFGDIQTFENVLNKTSYWEVIYDITNAFKYMKENRIKYNYEKMEKAWKEPEIIFE